LGDTDVVYISTNLAKLISTQTNDIKYLGTKGAHIYGHDYLTTRKKTVDLGDTNDVYIFYKSSQTYQHRNKQ
jgi:hypothetical protein